MNTYIISWRLRDSNKNHVIAYQNFDSEKEAIAEWQQTFNYDPEQDCWEFSIEKQ